MRGVIAANENQAPEVSVLWETKIDYIDVSQMSETIFWIMNPPVENNIHPTIKSCITHPHLLGNEDIYSPEIFRNRFNLRFEAYISENQENRHYPDSDKDIMRAICMYYAQINTIPANEYHRYSWHIQECKGLILQIHSILCEKWWILPRNSFNDITWERITSALDRLSQINEKEKDISFFIATLQNTDIPLHPQYAYEIIKKIWEYVDMLARQNETNDDNWEIWTHRMLLICYHIQEYIDAEPENSSLEEWKNELIVSLSIDPKIENPWVKIWQKIARYHNFKNQKKRTIS